MKRIQLIIPLDILRNNIAESSSFDPVALIPVMSDIQSTDKSSKRVIVLASGCGCGFG